MSSTELSVVPSLAWPEILLVLSMALISALTVAGNLVVLLSFALDRQIRQPSNFFIFSLAVSDLGIPVYTYFLVNGQRWPFGAFLCDLWLSIDYACCLASIYTVLGITADRYLSVKYPAAYRNWRTKKRVLLIIAGIWLVPSVLFSVSIFGYGWFSGKGRILKEDECYVQFMTNAYLNAGMYLSYYWSTLALMLYLYYGIYTAAKQLASKSDQKHRRLALLAEMRQDGAGTGRPDSREDQSLGLAMSEAPATLDQSTDSRPPRRVSARLLNALQNGRLLSLRTVVSAAAADDDRATGGGQQHQQPTVVLAAEPMIEPNQSTSVTTAGGGPNNNNEMSINLNNAQSNNNDPIDDCHSSSAAGEGKRPPSPTAVEPEPSSGAFSPDFGDEVPFIDDSAQSSVLSTPRERAETAETAAAAEGMRREMPKKEKNASAPVPSPPLAVRSQSTPAPSAAAAAVVATNHSGQQSARAATDCNNNSNQQQSNNRSRPLEFTLCSSLEVFMPADRSGPMPPLRHHSVRMHVHVQREMGAQGVAGVRRWLGAVRRGRLSQQSYKSRNGGGSHQRKLSKGSQSRSENRARKALRTITVILGTFTLFWTPFYVLATVYGFCERCTSSAGFQALYTVSYYLCYMNSPINPLCYAAANQQFKRTFKRILRGDLHRS